MVWSMGQSAAEGATLRSAGVHKSSLHSVAIPSYQDLRALLLIAAIVTWSSGYCVLRASAADEVPTAVLVRVDGDTIPEVISFFEPVLPADVKDQGLFVWSEGAQEFCQACPVREADHLKAQALSVGSRGGAFNDGENSQPGDALALTTTQIDQIRFLPRFKGNGFITPMQQGRHLNPRIAIRRQPRNAKPEYPAVTVQLLKRSRVVFEFPLKESQKKAQWNEIAGMPESLKAGLLPGEYVLRVKGGSESASFVVEDADLRESVWHLPNRLRKLLNTNADPLYLQVTAEHLLAQTDDRGTPQPYLADALDVLENVPADGLTQYLRRLRNDILDRLDAEPSSEDGSDVDDPTGIPAIDQARMLIVEGKWDEATTKLKSSQTLDTPRSQALATLYQAVVLSESAQTMEAETRARFRLAISRLADGKPADAYRAHNNYANFLLCRAQDRLYNQAFEVASGIPNSLTHSLMHWREALQHYVAAGKIAEQLDEEHQAAVRVNVARTYALLADVIRALDAPVSGNRRFTVQESAVHEYATELAKKVVECEAEEEVHLLTRAAAHEVLAHIAYRRSDPATCREHANDALSEYTASGSLPGIAGIYRLQGLLDLRSAATVESDAATAKQREAALCHFQVAHFLSEFLRQRIAEDDIGLTRAGYLARHAYINEQIISLLIEQGKDVEALQFVELAKARSLEDALTQGGLSNAARKGQAVDFLANWPSEVVALEYYLGSDRAWVFVVNRGGQVRGQVLAGLNNEPIRPSEMVADVHHILKGMTYQARKMLLWQRFDHTWEMPLHRLYQQLIPASAIEEMRKAEVVVFAPHHVLHYLPFAALVTKRDGKIRRDFEIPQARFLVDEGFAISTAPSLTTWRWSRKDSPSRAKAVNAVGIVDFPVRGTAAGGRSGPEQPADRVWIAC